MTDYNVTPANFSSTLGSAIAGDRLILADGSYGSVTITSKNGSSGSPITIIGATSPASASGAVFSALNLVNCNYITLDSLYVNAQIDMHDPGQSNNIIIQYCRSNGLNASYSDAVTYRFNTCVSAGIYFDRSTNFIADQNYTYDRRGDQFRGAGAAYVTISNNVMLDIFEIQGTIDDPHYDFIQSFAFDGVTPHHWTIYGNISIDNPATGVIGNNGADRLCEGYFFGSNDGYTNFTIDNNMVVVNSAEGMHIRGGNSTCVFSNNTLFGGGVMMNNMGVGYNDPMEFTDNIGNIYDLALGGAAPNASGNVAFSNIATVLADPYGAGSGGINSWQRFEPLPAYVTKGAATRLDEIRAGTNVYALELAGMTGMGGATPSAPSIPGNPTISGTEAVNQILTATPSTPVTGYPTPTRTWQWYNSVSGAIAGATSQTYQLQASDEGDTVYVIQTETNTEDVDTAPSSNTGTIAAAPTPPAVTVFSPLDNATSVAVDATLTITFDTTMQLGPSGRVNLWRPDDGIVDYWDVVTHAGTGDHSIHADGNDIIMTGWAIWPMHLGVTYSILIDNGALESTGGVAFPGIADTATWNFTTVGTDAPAFGGRILTSITVA